MGILSKTMTVQKSEKTQEKNCKNYEKVKKQYIVNVRQKLTMVVKKSPHFFFWICRIRL